MYGKKTGKAYQIQKNSLFQTLHRMAVFLSAQEQTEWYIRQMTGSNGIWYQTILYGARVSVSFLSPAKVLSLSESKLQVLPLILKNTIIKAKNTIIVFYYLS